MLLSQKLENRAKAIPHRKNDPSSLCVCVSAKAGTGGLALVCISALMRVQVWFTLCAQQSTDDGCTLTSLKWKRINMSNNSRRIFFFLNSIAKGVNFFKKYLSDN